jgi:Zn2+/Cd2+-exporting ATPase
LTTAHQNIAHGVTCSCPVSPGHASLLTIGIAMGGVGTAVALETVDVALMSDDLGKLPFAVGLSRASRTIIRQNLAISLGVIGLLIVTSVLGLVQLSWAVVLHEGSTIVVVLNALRLLGYRDH